MTERKARGEVAGLYPAMKNHKAEVKITCMAVPDHTESRNNDAICLLPADLRRVIKNKAPRLPGSTVAWMCGHCQNLARQRSAMCNVHRDRSHKSKDGQSHGCTSLDSEPAANAARSHSPGRTGSATPVRGIHPDTPAFRIPLASLAHATSAAGPLCASVCGRHPPHRKEAWLQAQAAVRQPALNGFEEMLATASKNKLPTTRTQANLSC